MSAPAASALTATEPGPPTPAEWPSATGEVARLRRVAQVERDLRKRGYGLRAAADAIVNYEMIVAGLRARISELERERR